MNAPIYRLKANKNISAALKNSRTRPSNYQRLESKTTSRLQQKADGSPNVSQLKSNGELINKNIPDYHRVVQRAVPEPNSARKPEPDPGRYRPVGGQDEVYNSKNYPRGRFSFGIHTRDDVFSRLPPEQVIRQGNRVVSIQDPQARQFVNVEGVQLDHRISWHAIATEMDRYNSQPVDPNHPRDNYTFWDAKRYYNDITNLTPVLGNFNAAAGDQGVQVQRNLPDSMNALLGRLHLSLTHLQQLAGARFEGQQNDQVPPEIADQLMKAADQIDEISEVMIPQQRPAADGADGAAP